MKKSIQVLLIAIILAGCSSFPNLPRLVSQTSPPPLDTSTPFISETPIPTQNLFATSTPTPLTFTPTVTALGAELFTPTSSETSFPTDFPTPDIPLDPSSSDYFTPQNTGFLAILISNNIIYWNEGPCSPRDIKISAFVEDQINTHHVLLFTRLREKKNTLNVTKWNAGALMVKADNGSFNYDVRTFNIRRYYYFVDAWLEYQLVAFNEDRDVIGRTAIYDRNISLVRCRPVP
jgi:PBP1b-binding outer membrane lipoprotein LpoB